MEKVDKSSKENFLGYVVVIIAVIFIIGFTFFSHHQNKVIIKNNMNEALKQDKTELISYTFDHKRYSDQAAIPLDDKHSSLYRAFYRMLHFHTEYGNDKIYEVTTSNDQKYEIDIDRKLQVVDWHKK